MSKTLPKTLSLPVKGMDLDAGMLPIGTVLRRPYKGKVYVVRVLAPLIGVAPHSPPEVAQRRGWWRYEYNGQRYKSLSAITREITGDPTLSGNRFFGLRRIRRPIKPWKKKRSRGTG